MKGFVFTVLVYFFSLMHSMGQVSDYVYTNFTVSSGLPSNECHTIIQDRSGYIWIGTDNGVARYDGYEFKQYGEKEGLGDMVIFKLFEDESGRIWAGGIQNKLFIYDPATDIFETYAYNSVLAKHSVLPNQFAKEFSVEFGKLFYSVHGLGVLEIDEEGAVDIHHLCDQSAYFVFQDSQNPLMLFGKLTKESRYVKFEFSNNSKNCSDNEFSTEYEVEYKILNSFGITPKSDSRLVYVNKNLFKTNCASIIWSRREPNINNVQIDKNENIVLSFENNLGCKIYSNIKENKYEYLINDASVTSFLEDRNGGYWLATIDEGLFHIKNRAIKFITPHHSQDYFTHIVHDDKGNLFTASFDGALEKVNLDSKNTYLINYDKGQDYQALGYNEFKDEIWYSNNTTTVVASGEEYQIKIELIGIEQRKFNSSTLYFDKNQAYTVRANRDLLIFESDDNKATFSYVEQFGDHFPFRSKSINKLGDSILVGSYNGLFTLYQDTLMYTYQKDSLLKTRIDDIHKDEQGNLYLGTKGHGLVVMTDHDEVYNISTSDGLLSDYLESITLGEDGVVWTSSLKGINRIEIKGKSDYHVQSITMDHGLPVPDVYDLEWYENTLYAATGSGVVEISPFPVNEQSINPRIDFIEVNQKNYSFNSDLTFDHDENNIRIAYKTIDFNQNKNITYRYRLNDREWAETLERSISLIDLVPNRYKFEVQSKNADGFWSESSVVNFSILAPWWSNKWLHLLLSLGIIGLIVNYFRRREQAINKENSIKQELRQLEKAALQSQMNPHFIFNSLNSIQNFIMGNDKLAAMDYLGRFAKLIRLTLNASAEETISLYDEIQLIEHYFSLEKLRFKTKFDYDIIIGEGVDIYNIQLPPMLIQPLVENAIKHGMNKVEEGGIIEVRLTKKGDRLHILVRDNGPELKAHKIHNTHQLSDERKKHRSHGMRITGKRLNMDEAIEVKRVDGWTEVGVWV